MREYVSSHNTPLLQHVYRDYKDFSAGGQTCRGLCSTSDLVVTFRRGVKGQTVQKHGYRFCKKCNKHFKPEVGRICFCCRQHTRIRVRTKQSREYRENQRVAADQKETYLQE